ncbi:MAG TPA: hypothetical protein VLA97_14565 [Nocardioidaceae bacterium]|nr:hypothetical protein [Nocardioidaceae bacterium]HSE71982.1 hypothetical protein [Nocardioidaceae bacterium]
MFDIHCPACERRQLIFSSQITGLVNDDQGIAVLYTCWCGTAGAWRTGAASESVRHEHVLAS